MYYYELRYDTDYVHYFLNLKKNKINQQIAHIFIRFVYTLHTSSRHQTMTFVVLFDFDCLHIDACSVFLFSYYYFRFSLIRFCIAVYIVAYYAASRTENCINNKIEKKCSRERLLYEYSYGSNGLGIVLHALMPLENYFDKQ